MVTSLDYATTAINMAAQAESERRRLIEAKLTKLAKLAKFELENEESSIMRQRRAEEAARRSVALRSPPPPRGMHGGGGGGRAGFGGDEVRNSPIVQYLLRGGIESMDG